VNCKNRLKLIGNFSDIFSLKGGDIFKCKIDNNCYHTPKWFIWSITIWYQFAFFLFIWLAFVFNAYTPLEGWFTPLLASVSTFIVLEFLIFLIMPLKKIECWKVNMESQRRRNIEIGKGKEW